MAAILDKKQFKKLENKNIYISDDKLLSAPICKYTDLFNLLLLLSNEFYVGAKKRFSDMLESGDCFLNFSVDLNIIGEPLSKMEWKMSQQMREDVKETRDWLTSCWTLKTEEDYFMWKTYAPNLYSVKIETSLLCLLDSLDLSDYEVYISKMNYQDDRHILKDFTAYMFYKYSYYKGEEEVRLYFLPLNPKETKHDSVYLKVKSPDKLITGITLSPFLSQTSKCKLKEFLIKEYNIERELIQTSKIKEHSK